jgi:hypothetical protein
MQQVQYKFREVLFDFSQNIVQIRGDRDTTSTEFESAASETVLEILRETAGGFVEDAQ